VSRNLSTTRQVNLLLEERLRALKGTRDYILIQNTSANDIYINIDTHADVNNGITISAGLYWERDKNVPQNDIYVRGSVASPALQQLNVVEGYS
jgi:hypothetical protein